MTGAPYKKGERVRIKRDAIVYSTHPRRKNRVVARPYAATVWDSYPEYRDPNDSDKMKSATVHWVGAGGYWCWTDAANVEKLT
jgi:hypothetical protein